MPEGFRWYDGIDPAAQREKRLSLLREFAYLPNEGDFLESLIDFPGRREVLTNNPRNRHVLGDREFLNQAREIANPSLRERADQLINIIDSAHN